MTIAMGLPEDVRTEVLKVLVLKKMATSTVVAEVSGIPLKEVESAVDELQKTGDVVDSGGHLLATEAGEDRIRAYADARYAPLREDPAVERWSARFEPINRRFLETVSAWQVIPMADGHVPNDHSDPRYDERIVSRLEACVVRMSKLLDELSDRVPRMARYKQRLEAALTRLDNGDTDYVSEPRLDSLHTVWFEMHESILIVLGQERTE